MLTEGTTRSCFSTDDVPALAEFYGTTLGLDVELMDGTVSPMMLIHLPGGGETLVYAKEDHSPATHTVLMFEVPDFDASMAALQERGVDLVPTEYTGEDGIARDPEGRMPTSAWTRDPSGNWLHFMERRL